MKILGISGRRQSGKDTLAYDLFDALKPASVAIRSTADWPKEILRTCGVPRDALWGTDAQKCAMLPCGIDGREATRRMMRLMELVGGDRVHIRRALDDCSADWLLLPCVRNVADVEEIHAAGGRVIRLTRRVFPADTYAEELALDGYPDFDAWIYNAACDTTDALRGTLLVLRRWGWCTEK